MSYRVAVIGATGNVGREMISILAERNFPVTELAPLATQKSLGMEIKFGQRTLSVGDVESFDFEGWDIALFAAGSGPAEQYAPRCGDAGCIAIDNSSHFRYDPEIPLIVPEVNPDSIADARNHNIIANPNCSTAQMVLALAPLHAHARIRRVVVSTYQSVSGSGKAAMDELWEQTRSMYTDGAQKEPAVYPVRIAFNVIPHIDCFLANGSTREEWKMAVETKRIIDPAIDVTATCVRVPVFVGHCEAINVEFEEELEAEEARDILRDSPGIEIVDEMQDGGYATPQDCVGESMTYISRIRNDPTAPHALNLWCVSDNLRKGAAQNAVQIAELVSERILRGD